MRTTGDPAPRHLVDDLLRGKPVKERALLAPLVVVFVGPAGLRPELLRHKPEASVEVFPRQRVVGEGIARLAGLPRARLPAGQAREYRRKVVLGRRFRARWRPVVLAHTAKHPFPESVRRRTSWIDRPTLEDRHATSGYPSGHPPGPEPAVKMIKRSGSEARRTSRPGCASIYNSSTSPPPRRFS